MSNRVSVMISSQRMKLILDGSYVSYTKTGTGTLATYIPTYHFYMKDHLSYLRRIYQ